MFAHRYNSIFKCSMFLCVNFFYFSAMAQGLLQVQSLQQRSWLSQLLWRTWQGNLLYHRLCKAIRAERLRLWWWCWLSSKWRICQWVINNSFRLFKVFLCWLSICTITVWEPFFIYLFDVFVERCCESFLFPSEQKKKKEKTFKMLIVVWLLNVFQYCLWLNFVFDFLYTATPTSIPFFRMLRHQIWFTWLWSFWHFIPWFDVRC